jgi:hypothetical protein
LSKIKNLKLFYFQNLHAKCYFNDKEMVITSMNMYEFSEKNNREMGIYVTMQNDLEIVENALAETSSIVKSSKVIELYIPKGANKPNKNNPIKLKTTNSAYCIRCGKSIKFNPDKPLCWDCYTVWTEFDNPEYEENQCHGCGNHVSTTMLKPFCYPCFKELEM